MTQEEKYIARLMFKLKILQNDGQSFENLFIRVMQYHNHNFIPVKPQGPYGDKKNDGFDKQAGKYYQVYAPENIQSKEKETISKLKDDFDGLYKYWNNDYAITEFYYVVNDKYKGVYPTLFPELRKIEQNYPSIKVNPFLSKNLEDIFLGLEDNEIYDVIGYIPNAMNISNIDPSILGEVIDFILNQDTSYQTELIPDNPDFEKKITFNNLSKPVGALLNYGRFQNYVIDDYFYRNSDFAREELRNKFTFFYEDGLKKNYFETNQSDTLFLHILNEASPSNKKPIKDAVLVLMAHYFEYCDIFETPTKKSVSNQLKMLF